MAAFARNSASHAWGRGGQNGNNDYDKEEEGMIQEKSGMWNSDMARRKRPRCEIKSATCTFTRGLSPNDSRHKSELSSSPHRSTFGCASKSQNNTTPPTSTSTTRTTTTKRTTARHDTMCQNFVGRRDDGSGQTFRQRSTSRSPTQSWTGERNLGRPDYRGPHIDREPYLGMNMDVDRNVDVNLNADTDFEVHRPLRPHEPLRNPSNNDNHPFRREERWENNRSYYRETAPRLEHRQAQGQGRRQRPFDNRQRILAETPRDYHCRGPGQMTIKCPDNQQHARYSCPEDQPAHPQDNMRRPRDSCNTHPKAREPQEQQWRRSDTRNIATFGNPTQRRSYPPNHRPVLPPDARQATQSIHSPPLRYAPAPAGPAGGPWNPPSRVLVQGRHNTGSMSESVPRNDNYYRGNATDTAQSQSQSQTPKFSQQTDEQRGQKRDWRESNPSPPKKRWCSTADTTMVPTTASARFEIDAKAQPPLSTDAIAAQIDNTISATPLVNDATKIPDLDKVAPVPITNKKTTYSVPTRPGENSYYSQQMPMNSTTKAESTISNLDAVVNEPPLPAKKTTLGIPMRWLKPAPKPKIVKKHVPSKAEVGASETKAQVSKIEELAPSSPLINRMVTDSEGGSTVSHTRDLFAMMEKRPKLQEIPTAIITKPKQEDVSLDSPNPSDDETKNNKSLKIKVATKKKHSLAEDDETDDEPPLESDDNSSTDSSSEDSDTDDEEVMLWASKMFGVSLPPKTEHAFPEEKDETKEHAATTSRKPLKLRFKLSPSKKGAGNPRPASADALPTSLEANRRIYKETKKLMQLQKRSEEFERDEVYCDQPIRLAVRGRRKMHKSYLKKLPAVTPEEREVDLEQERIEREEEKRIRQEAKPLTAAQIREILGEDDFQSNSSSNWVRRSVRQPSRAMLNSKPLKALVAGLKSNDPDMVVLKMKKYINDPNAPSVVLDAALEALEENTNCEALYIQNFNEGMRDKQVLHLLRILQSSTCKIWCLNIGENYNVETDTWDKFTKGLRRTKITHMYASEHTITTEMKDEIRETIRENRSKHDMHVNPNNLDVIIQCTHCWWNPINAKALRPYVKKKGYEHILNDKEAQGLRGSTSEAPSA